jgi:hypothetical protein
LVFLTCRFWCMPLWWGVTWKFHVTACNLEVPQSVTWKFHSCLLPLLH